jgi:probable phosphoglycerate mutase
MSITTIYIVRHAETTGNIEKRLTGRKDYEITENGKKMIRKLEEKLENVKFDLAFSYFLVSFFSAINLPPLDNYVKRAN